MGNCFITKLKGVVAYTHLAKMNEVVLRTTSNESKIDVDGTKTITVKDMDGANVLTTDKSTYKNTISNTQIRSYCNSTNRYISISDKIDITYLGLKAVEIDTSKLRYISNLTGIAFNSVSGYINLNDLAQMQKSIVSISFAYMPNFIFDLNEISKFTNLSTFSAFKIKSITGNISSLPKTLTSLKIQSPSVNGTTTGLALFTALTSIDIFSSNVTGSIADLGSLSLTYLSAANTSITGSIEEYVRRRREHDVTGEINISVPSTVTFNGKSISTNEEKQLSWTSSTITYDNTTINA